MRIRFSPAGQARGFEEFLSGFLSNDKLSQYGRPTGVALALDGALLVSDDSNGTIYRVSWAGLGAARR